MKTRWMMLLLPALLFALGVQAQQNVGFKDGTLVSPQVNSDNSVTFRLNAPKAQQVMVIGDWEANDGKGNMLKGTDGVWTYTTPVLPSEMYTYRFSIDGVTGLDPANPFTKRDVGTIFSMFFVDGYPADFYQVQDVPHGTVLQQWYHSDKAGTDRRLSVYLPAGYQTGGRNYPVLYLLHGSGGDETAWLDLGMTARIMDNLIAQKKAEPMIVVIPNGNFGVQAAAGETKDNLRFRPVMSNQIKGNYKNGDYEMAFPEIINFIERTYRVKADKAHRAVAGLSMGGFHTLYISANYPEKFDYMGLFSAGIRFSADDAANPVYNNLDQKLQTLQTVGYKLYWISIGKDDFLYKANREYMQQLDKLGFKYEYHESTRGHLWCNWRQYLLQFAQRLFKE